ncbi:helix-turn-helix transcriptional regulator [Rheinheimera baltica]|uniref:Helix-turn-helix transcriptional regulator n=1 Tax=Rheinheimera baltica TaxID=67576 RepID=A0ABT9HX60_9GAMM|nr:helix-turn-helix transcriptional regulator [Rheinheimera baltica]MDP5135707.1 helix-turn-helix transcriptional regulator [Rheinheimera baltica]
MASQTPFPARLKQVRKARGLTQKALGVRIGFDVSSADSRMNHYETGRHLPDYDVAKKLADELDVPVAYFFCDSDEMADLLMSFHKLTAEQRKKVQEFINAQKQAD